MTCYANLTREQAKTEFDELTRQHAALAARGLSLDMSRGKPSAAQLDLSEPLLTVLRSAADCLGEDGTDCRNYGVLAGIPEARRLMAEMLDDEPANTIVLGNSSLTAMHDALARLIDYGACGGRPWHAYDELAWLCPVPGYDRHFAITESFGIRMIPVPMDEHGPNMDVVEQLAASDERVKGIWCVPKYSNPGGVTYSDEVVRRLAAMECAAGDFRIFWDNAYCVHHLYDDAARQDKLLDIGRACAEAGNVDRYLKFGSTSKVTFPGAGIAAMAASPANVADALAHLSVQMIGQDKLNQLRHVRFLHDGAGIAAHMAEHAAIMRPKFELVLDALERELGSGGEGAGIGSWARPRGGYFISFDAPEGTAKRIVELAGQAGVKMTEAGATWPGGEDPADSNIRIAPSLPPTEELEAATKVFCCCAKLAALEKLLAE